MKILILVTLFLTQIVFAQVKTDEIIVEVTCYNGNSDIRVDYKKSEQCNGHGCGFGSSIKLSTKYSEVWDSDAQTFVSHDQYVINFRIPFHTASVISPIEGVLLGKYYDASLVVYTENGVFETYPLRCKHSGEIPNH